MVFYRFSKENNDLSFAVCGFLDILTLLKKSLEGLVSTSALKITKTLRQVSIWVHPEGRVNGEIFVAAGDDADIAENPCMVLNNDTPFLVLRTEKADDVRFYNRNAIVRAEFESVKPTDDKLTRVSCQITMMDGSVINGQIIEELPEEHARLYDYLNQTRQRFIRLFTSDDEVCMVNKSYVVKVTIT